MPVKQVWKETWRRVNDDRICTAQSNTAVLGHLFGTGTNSFCKFTASDKKAISENVLFYQCMCRNWHRTLERRSRWAPWQWIYSHDVHSLTEWKGTVCKHLIIHLFAETRAWLIWQQLWNSMFRFWIRWYSTWISQKHENIFRVTVVNRAFRFSQGAFAFKLPSKYKFFLG